MTLRPVSPDEFRATLGRFVSGVTILTAHDDETGYDHGMTVSSFCSVSLTPPLVLACIAREADMFRCLPRASHFGISVLTTEQEDLSRRFAALPSNRFDGVDVTRGESGVLLLQRAHAQLECRRVHWHEAGDHAICVGEVVRAAAGEGSPLVYYRSGYTRLDR